MSDMRSELEAMMVEWGAESEPNQYAYWKQLRAILAKFPPLMEAELRAKIAAEIRGSVDDMGDPDPTWRAGMMSAATIAEGSAS